MTRPARWEEDTAGETPQVVEPGAGSWTERVTRFWVTLLILAVILYVAVLVMGRTAGFRDIVRERLEKRLGLPLTVQGSTFSLGLDLSLVGVSERGMTNRLPALVVDRATLHWRWPDVLRGRNWPLRALTVQGAALRFRRTPEGGWSPLPDVQAMLAPWTEGAVAVEGAPPEAAPEPGLTEWLRARRWAVDVSGGTVSWDTGEGDVAPAVWVHDIDFSAAPTEPFGESALWLRLRINQAERDGASWLDRLAVDWIRLADHDVVLRVDGLMFPMADGIGREP
jgi:hypothetical protein